MPRLNRFQILNHIKPLIIRYFEDSPKKIYSTTDIDKILWHCKCTWTLPNLTTREEFINFLLNKNILKEFKIHMPNETIKRYTFKNISIYEIALDIKKKSYLSHYTAVFLYNLTNNVPKNIYSNTEQTKKPIKAQNNILVQANIDKAFSRPMRYTNQIGKVENSDYNIYFLNGKNVDQLGVTEYEVDSQELRITSIERTLIDIAVRPEYAGGAYEVLNAYKNARGNFSVNKLVATLKKMQYVYPYHQVIGFYMEKAGYSENLLNLLSKINIKYNFYLTYQMKNMNFSERWKLFFPKGF